MANRSTIGAVTPDTAHEMGAFIDVSPTPYHAVSTVVSMLVEAGFEAFDPASATSPGRRYANTGGTVVAWHDAPSAAAPMRCIAAHTDSPNLRIRPRPDVESAGIHQLGVEVYGGPLLNSWLDRDLGLAGRVVVRSHGVNGAPDHTSVRLFRTVEPQLRVPQLAIHLDREISERGLVLDRQRHMTPMWSLVDGPAQSFAAWLADRVGASASDVLAWDVSCFDTQRHAVLGATGEFLASGRLDNLASCFGAVRALLDLDAGSDPASMTHTPVIMLFDHEEVGSGSSTGAGSQLLARVLEQRALALGVDRSGWLAMLDGSTILSADMAHATHPNYPERHDPSHGITLGGGPAIKYNSNERYATDAVSAAEFKQVCDDSGIVHQEYSHRGDIPCGSTIGPILASGLAVPTVDVGMPQLSMHSAREVMATADVTHMVRAFGAWLGVASR